MKNNNKKDTGSVRNVSAAASVVMMLKGLAAAVLTAAAGVPVCGLLLSLTSLSVSSSVPLLLTFITAGAFINAFAAACAAGRRGLIVGLAAGVIYTGAIIAFIAIALDVGFGADRAALFAVPVAASGAAGVLGVGRAG